MPGLWLLASCYFRAEVRGLHNVPAEGPVLLVDFNGRKGYIRLALEKDVTVVPVVAIGGQETSIFLSRGERLARLLGITRWDVEGRKRRGCGARYRILMRVGSVEVGGLVEVVEFEEPGDMAWTSVLGVDQRGRWRLREHSANRTSVMFRMSYHAPGGLLGADQSRTQRAKPAKRQPTRA